jgi:hypothetical protein
MFCHIVFVLHNQFVSLLLIHGFVDSIALASSLIFIALCLLLLFFFLFSLSCPP